MEQVTQRRVPAAGAPKPQTSAPNSIFGAGQAAAADAPKGRRTYTPTPMIDITALVIRKGVPLPARCANESRSEVYRKVLQGMEPGDSFVVDKRTAKTFQETARRMGIKVALRQDAADKSQVGVWRQ